MIPSCFDREPTITIRQFKGCFDYVDDSGDWYWHFGVGVDKIIDVTGLGMLCDFIIEYHTSGRDGSDDLCCHFGLYVRCLTCVVVDEMTVGTGVGM